MLLVLPSWRLLLPPLLPGAAPLPSEVLAREAVAEGTMIGSAIFTEERPPRREWLPGQESSIEIEAESCWEELNGLSSGGQLEGA